MLPRPLANAASGDERRIAQLGAEDQSARVPIQHSTARVLLMHLGFGFCSALNRNWEGGLLVARNVEAGTGGQRTKPSTGESSPVEKVSSRDEVQRPAARRGCL